MFLYMLHFNSHIHIRQMYDTITTIKYSNMIAFVSAI
jgi:hypothetical protein